MKRIKTIILLLTLVLFLTSCNFNDIFEPILEIPEVPTAEFSERPTNELITEEKTSETDEPEEELIIYIDPSPLLSDSTLQNMDLNVTGGKEFLGGDEASYEYKIIYDEERKNYSFKDGLFSNGEFRSVELTYTQTYQYEIWRGHSFEEFVGEDVRVVYGSINPLVEWEDFSVNREELGYRPSEEVALKNATDFANWGIVDFSTTDKSPYVATVVMNPISEEGEEFDGAGVVNFVRYAHGMKTQDNFYIKFNCDGIPYEMKAITTGLMSIAWYSIDEEELQMKSKWIDDTFGKDYTIGEKVLIRALDTWKYHITAEISRTDSEGNNISTRIYVPVEMNDKPPLA